MHQDWSLKILLLGGKSIQRQEDKVKKTAKNTGKKDKTVQHKDLKEYKRKKTKFSNSFIQIFPKKLNACKRFSINNEWQIWLYIKSFKAGGFSVS